ncbi:type ISP restriction/modification enzyme [Thermicanus aegyptius]|uniref:type ISP restriction/modification enzyme n=1 Tax=Thermicanus aegyptius TaxID=94009 RepID=UPI0004156490|nr:type ISP restriction/modification enzyme [Thermicanus aegyptius]
MNVQELLERLEKTATNTVEKGEIFERFVIAFLKNDPYYKEEFIDVWKWYDWPDRDKDEPDLGIDIVAKERDTGKLWAIQAKSHEEKVSYDDIKTFLAVSGRKEFSRRMIVTASPLGQNAEKAIKGQEKEVTVITLYDIVNNYGIDWESFQWHNPENITYEKKKNLRPYQEQAIKAVTEGFVEADRGKLIMPPGSGKTLVALKIAEKQVGQGGHVLFLAPSIALVEQTLRAWLVDADIPLRVFAVTSDRTVGKDQDSIDRLTVLTIPPTTNAEDLVKAIQQEKTDSMTVVVSTYHSIDVIKEAQNNGFPEFDLIIADEAHRTTGVVKNGEESYYTKVHNNQNVNGKKRLYMTATPRIYVPKLKEKLEEMEIEYFSMDNETIYGKEFFRYGFGQAVDDGHLCDYKVIVFAVSENEIQTELFEYLNQPDTPEVVDATRIIGTWRALSGHVRGEEIPAARRAVVFAGQAIRDSRNFAKAFQNTVSAFTEKTGEKTHHFKVRHVDGTMTATERKEHLDWLRGEPDEGEVRVLSNARVLTEGIDVPSLDAVVFLKPRKSQVDVVQAVGRVMRKAPGKEYGYVIIPVVVNPETNIEVQIRNNEEFSKVWEILSALRSLDDRFDARVRQIVLKKRNTSSSSSDEESDDILIMDHTQGILPLQFEEIKSKIIGVLVERVGEKNYFENWAKDVAEVAQRIERHIDEALKSDGKFGEEAREAFSGYVESLRQITNPTVTEDDARSMLVQHIITKPIFDALFENYDFLKQNAVSGSFERVAAVFKAFIEKETATLEGFYRSVKNRARGMDKEAERQDFLRRLYDRFFKSAFPRLADRLGIVYTPVEVVDFLVASADRVLHDEFGLSLSDEGVVILEPFSGTGTFLTRLMHLIPKEALERKYREGEIWGNEILLLPYYIALANVESTYFDITGKHEPFENLLLIDSFQLMESEETMETDLFPEQYTELMRKQKEAKINVIVSNPPWFAKQEEENLGIKSVKYNKLDEKISQTYVAYSSTTNKNSLYDSYIRAIRMATDRIEDKGVITFVTNSGFLDGNAASGLRKSLAEEFAKIYVLNLRGNARLSGEAWRKEGGKIFGQGSRAGVALLVLVKDVSKASPAEIYYHDIGDYLSREEKLARLKEYGHIGGVVWERIKPNKAHDWINQRSKDFEAFPVIGAKQNGDKETIFELYSSGVKTHRDAWVYNFSKLELADNMRRMIDEFNRHVELVRAGKITQDNLELQINNDPGKIGWSLDLKGELLRGSSHRFEEVGFVTLSVYRPFVKEWLYFSKVFNGATYLLPKIFPEPDMENVAIVMKGAGGTKDFTALIVDCIPDVNMIDGGAQTFPLYTYEPVSDTDALAGKMEGEIIGTAPSGRKYIRRMNITDWALQEYRRRYGDSVTKEDIFYFVYGFLHSPEYRVRYRNDLKKALPRIPFVSSAKDFWAFSSAGRKLSELHLNYETVEPWPLEEEIKGDLNDLKTYTIEKMRFGKTPDGKPDKTTIVYNEHITLRGIQLEAYEYVVNGRSPIEWVMERYQITKDKKSGITNDPNEWLKEQGNPRHIVNMIKSLVRVSVETIEIVKALPKS